jgi:phosphoenolpyruvate carboxykinase (ATP)
LQSLLDEVENAIAQLPGQPNVFSLSADEIRSRAEELGTRTVFGNTNWVSTVKNRSAALTVHLGGPGVAAHETTSRKRDIRKHAPETVRTLHRYLKSAPLLRVDCRVGDNAEFAPECTMYLSNYRRETARLAHKVIQTFFASRRADGDRLALVLVPEWQEKDRQILVFPEIGVTYVLGTDYFGEARNAFLRMAMWRAKQQGMLGLHAGTKIVRALGQDGRLRRLAMLLFGTASGKTTHVCSDHGLDLPGEGVEIAQDQVVFWRRDGSALGSERGFYIKTEGLNPDSHPLLYRAATSPNAVLDNVMVDYQGNVCFEDRTLTANGRAIIQRGDLGDLAGPSIDIPPLAELDGLIVAFLVRKYTVVPVASRLTPEQAAVAFLLAESIDAASSDAKEIGGNPLLVGNPADEANAFYELVRSHESKVGCYMLNTGGVGELVEQRLDGARKVASKVTRVEIPELAAVIRGIARDTVRWREDPDWMVETPEDVDGLDVSRFDLRRHYDQSKIDFLIGHTRLERAEQIEAVPGLAPQIKRAVEF